MFLKATLGRKAIPVAAPKVAVFSGFLPFFG
jgi:hypothetical protein